MALRYRIQAFLVGSALLLQAPALGRAQSSATSASPDLFLSLRPDVSIVVHKHSTGADMVEITVLSATFPPEELRQRAAAIGSALGSPDRGLTIFNSALGNSQHSSLLKATFATNGILNGAAGLKLQPLVRAFAGGTGESKVQGVDIVLPGVTPGPQTLFRYESKGAIVQAQQAAKLPMLEYRVQLLSQDPTQIIIPDLLTSSPAASPTSAPQNVSLWVFVILTTVAGLAAGFLVYNLALRKSIRTDRGSGSVHK